MSYDIDIGDREFNFTYNLSKFFHDFVCSPDEGKTGLIEVDGGDDYGRIVFDPELAGIVAHAILHCCDDITHFQKKVEAKIAEPVKSEAPVADDEGWIEYDGTGNPFKKRTEIMVELRSGRKITDNSDWFDWDHDGMNGDIVAYRLSKESVAL